MECSVCYGECGPFQKLACGHDFCTGCVKTWYLKGTGTGCPMCRAPIYFKGFHKVRDQWNEDAWENKCADVFGQALDELFTEAQEFANEFSPKWHTRIFKELVDDFIEIEKTYRFLKNEGVSPEDMEDVFYWGDYYSDRHMDKYSYLDDPVKEFVPAVHTRGRGKGFKRSRALQDTWAALGLYYIEV